MVLLPFRKINWPSHYYTFYLLRCVTYITVGILCTYDGDAVQKRCRYLVSATINIDLAKDERDYKFFTRVSPESVSTWSNIGEWRLGFDQYGGGERWWLNNLATKISLFASPLILFTASLFPLVFQPTASQRWPSSCCCLSCCCQEPGRAYWYRRRFEANHKSGFKIDKHSCARWYTV